MIFNRKKDNLSELVGSAGFFLGTDIKAEGSINTDDDVYVDSVFKGDITTPGVAEVGKSAKLQGSVKARNIILEGKINATVEALESIHIASCAEISGKLNCARVRIDNGAAINATIKTGEEQE